jgi:hypothetical protein
MRSSPPRASRDATPRDCKRLHPAVRYEQESSLGFPCLCQQSRSLVCLPDRIKSVSDAVRSDKLPGLRLIQPVMAKNISADAFILVVRTFRPCTFRRLIRSPGIDRFRVQRAFRRADQSTAFAVSRQLRGHLAGSGRSSAKVTLDPWARSPRVRT